MQDRLRALVVSLQKAPYNTFPRCNLLMKYDGVS